MCYNRRHVQSDPPTTKELRWDQCYCDDTICVLELFKQELGLSVVVSNSNVT